MPFAKIDGVNIYYEVHGHGQPVVFLHHGFGSTKIWKHIYPTLVENGFSTIMYDRRGYGQSEKGSDFQKYYLSDRFRPESVAELANLMEFIRIDAFHLVCQCEGGVIGVDYAVKYPDRVKTMIIAGTQCYNNSSAAEFNKSKLPDPFQDLDPEKKEKLIYWHGKEHAESFYNMARTLGGAYGTGLFDLRPLLPSVKCPTLVLYPDRSYLFEIEQAVTFYRHLPKGELAVLPNCGHNTYEERPEEYIRLVTDFLGRQAF
jgi:pimeloyl-ACP methyl ester carboxylesterase